MPRLSPVPESADDPIVRDVFERTLARASEVPNLYRTIAHAPGALRSWVGLTWPLRDSPASPRRLQELIIMRVSHLVDATYEAAHHRPMALTHGIRVRQLDELADWQHSREFDDEERIVLRYADAVVAMAVDDEIFAAMQARFSSAAVVELTLAASFYCGVLPRVIQALGIELEPRYLDAPAVNREV
jgi:4-carboxymuconolactone decarboxylase